MSISTLTRIDEICSTISETYRGKDKKVILINTSDVLEGKILNFEEVENKNLRGQFKKTFKKNDILFSEIRPANKRFAFVNIDDTHNFIASTKLMVLRPNLKRVLPEFLYYILSSDYLLSEMQHLAETRSGTFPQITFSSELGPFEIELPDINCQRKIVSILKNIDEKIELNNEINDNLMQQMISIYTSHIEKNDALLVKLDDLVSKSNTGADAIQKAPIVEYDTGVRCARVGDLSNKRPINEWGFSKVTDDVFKQYKLVKNDILVTRTATLGLNTIIDEDCSAVYNNGLIRLQINENKAFPLLIYLQFQTKDFSNYINRITGETSVRPNMKINYLLEYKFKLTSLNKQKEIYKTLESLFIKQRTVINENATLSKLRDSLLPKLMSGEIDVDSIEL